MNEQFKIYPEQLRDGRIEKIQAQFDPDFLEIDDPELQFKHPVSVSGEAYLADDNLVLHLEIQALASMPCAICNELAPVEINVTGLYHVEPLAEIKGGIFFLQGLLREAILLEVPKFAECSHGNCPGRTAIARFLKKGAPKFTLGCTKGSIQGSVPEELNGEGYRPFADIDLD